MNQKSEIEEVIDILHGEIIDMNQNKPQNRRFWDNGSLPPIKTVFKRLLHRFCVLLPH